LFSGSSGRNQENQQSIHSHEAVADGV